MIRWVPKWKNQLGDIWMTPHPHFVLSVDAKSLTWRVVLKRLGGQRQWERVEIMNRETTFGLAAVACESCARKLEKFFSDRPVKAKKPKRAYESGRGKRKRLK